MSHPVPESVLSTHRWSCHSIDPIRCDSGYFTSATGQLECALCEAGHDCSGRTQSVECDPGYFSSEGQGSCSPCASGYYSSAGLAACTPCPGTALKAHINLCDRDPVGHQCLDAALDPVACPKGYYSPGAAPCELCPFGSVPDGDQASCVSCPGIRSMLLNLRHNALSWLFLYGSASRSSRVPAWILGPEWHQ